MAKWREARDTNLALPSAEQEELEALVEAEAKVFTLRAMGAFNASNPH